MIPPWLITLGLRALKAALHVPQARQTLAATVAAEGLDVGPQAVAALQGNTQAIDLFERELDEAMATNRGLVADLEAQVRRERGEP